MKVAFHLTRRPGAAPATAAWLIGRDASALLDLCGRLGLDPTGRAFDVAGGFLLKLDAPTDRPLPGAVRLRALSPDLFLPADADLAPALLDDEATGLVRDRGLVFLPGGRVLGYDRRAPLDLATLVTAGVAPRRDWRPFPEPPPLADRIVEIVVERPDETPESVLDGGGDGGGEVGTEPPRPPVAGPASTLLGRAALAAGQGLARLGGALGWGKLAAVGAGWVDRALRIAPRLSEDVIDRQAASLRELLRQFRDGDVETALKHALPLGTPGESRGAGPYAGDRLPPLDLSYGLGGLLADGGSGGGTWVGGQDLMGELTAEYRKAALEALRRGDFRRAAAIYGKLLRDYRAAAHALLRGGMHHDAAVLFLEKLDDPRAAALAFESAGEVDRAVQLYRKVGAHESAGDLLRRVGEEDAAVAEYLAAADALSASPDGLLAAGNLLLTKAGRPDLALPRFLNGWSRRPGGNAVACALQVAGVHAEAGDARSLLALVGEADAYFDAMPDLVESRRLYNTVATLAGRPALGAFCDELRDRALLGLAAQIRHKTGLGEASVSLVSTLMGTAGVWPAAVVSDAAFALAAVAKPAREAPASAAPQARRYRVGVGTVTAVTSAAASGTLFLGFEGGEIYAFRPERSEAVHVASYDLPVSALATDPDGERLVVLRSGRRGFGIISSYARQPDGTYRLMLGLPVDGLVEPWLTPVVFAAEWGVGLWDGRSLGVLSVDGLTALAAFRVATPEPRPPAGLLLVNEGAEESHVTVFMHGGLGWCEFDDSGKPRHETGLSWSPTLPPDSPLRSVPLSWAGDPNDHFELAGLGPFGTLHWARLQDGELVASNTMTGTEEGGGYLAAAVVRDGLVAGVTRSRVDWLRCGASKFLPWRSTALALPSAVACAVCPQTRELIVVCGDGFVARLPIPNS